MLRNKSADVSVFYFNQVFSRDCLDSLINESFQNTVLHCMRNTRGKPKRSSRCFCVLSALLIGNVSMKQAER